MTEENYNYRTSPLFLRNEFKGDGKWQIPIISKPDIDLSVNEDLRLIGFDKVKTDKDEHYDRIVHFFLYDYKFEDIWTNPDKYVNLLKRYKAVLTPDYSIYTDMNPTIQLYNTFRNRWVGAYLKEKGIKVIPTVSWGLENTFDFCFNGIEKGSVVAISTYMVSEHGNRQDQKEFFMKGYNEMLRRIEPELIICYNTPFPEMMGNILFVDYNLSSWRHYNDDVDKSFIVTKTYYYDEYDEVLTSTNKGMGDSHGGKWKPKKEEDKRLQGQPNSYGEYINSKGEIFLQKYDSEGRAVLERHLTDHGFPKHHSNPHDHIIDWQKGFPDFETKIDYFDIPAPEFKFYQKGYYKMKTTNDHYYDDNNFASISDFKWSLIHGGEIVFEWKENSYGIFRNSDKRFSFSQANNQESEVICKSPDEILDIIIDGQKLREFITEVTVTHRNV